MLKGKSPFAFAGPEGAALCAQGSHYSTNPLLFKCAKTVSELHLFQLLGLPFERKQIPQIVVNVRTSRQTTEPLETTRLPWAQGVGRSNRPAPTNRIS